MPLELLVGDGVDVHGGLIADVHRHHLVLADLRLHLHVGEPAHQHHHVLGEVRSADALADLVAQLEDGPVDGRGQRRPREVVEGRVQLADVLRHQLALRGETAFVHLQLGGRLLQIGGAGEPLVDQPLDATKVALVLLDGHLDLRDLRPRGSDGAAVLRHLRLVEALVDLSQHLAALDAIAFLHAQRQQIAGDVAAHFHRLPGLQVAGRRHHAGDRAFLRHRGGDLHRRRRFRTEPHHGGERHQRDHQSCQDPASPRHVSIHPVPCAAPTRPRGRRRVNPPR